MEMPEDAMTNADQGAEPAPDEVDNGASSEDGQSRQRSTIKFPYGDLNDAVIVATFVQDQGGGSCTLDQLASWMDHESVLSGTFRMKVTAARIFGLVETGASRDSLNLTLLGRRIVDPQHERKARVDAFLTVPLYRLIYEKYKGVALPRDTGLETAMVSFGVSPKQRDKARQAFQRSADQARVFSPTRDRLVLPGGLASAASNGAGVAFPQPPVRQGESTFVPAGPGPRFTPEPEFGEPPPQDNGNQRPLAHESIIESLFEELPAPGAPWSARDREKWFTKAEFAFNLVYGKPAEA